ncbi:MAG TPA: TIGR02234 family membrane protein [Mycobacterium sp.]
MTRVAQLLLVLAAIGLWLASRLPWVVLRSADGLGQPRTTTLSGGSWSTGLIPFAVLLLAAAVAALAVRGWPLRLVAVLVAVVSAGAAYLAITLWTTPDVAPRAAQLADVPVVWLVGSSRQNWGAVLTLVAAVATLLAAVLLMRSAVRGTSRTEKYMSPARRRTAAGGGDAPATASERTIWDALDEGDDPTR